MADPDGMDRPDVNVDALKSEIRRQLINQKVLPGPWPAMRAFPGGRARLPAPPGAALAVPRAHAPRTPVRTGQRLPHRHEDGVACGWHL